MIDAAEHWPTLGGLVAQAAARWPERTALLFDATGERLDFAELDARTNRLARTLAALGVRPGDRVAVMAANGPLFPVAWLGIAKAGAAMVPLNIAYRDDDAHHLLAHAGVVLALCDEARAPLLRRLAPTLRALRGLIVDGTAAPGETAWSEALGGPPAPALDLAAGPEQLANVQFTSGTTGLPKGCMLSHGYWTRLGALIAGPLVGLDERDVMLTAQPFSYIDPQWNLMAALSGGATLVVLERFRPSQYWAAVQRHRASFVYCLGAMPLMLLAQTPAADEREHRLRVVMCSGIPPDRHAELEARFGVPWREVFGTTETGADIMVHPRDAERLCGSGSIGHAMPHREARIVGNDGRPVPPGERGELLLRGTGMMDGYFGHAEATAKAFADGWYHTGDLARQGEGGELYIVGRLKDMIRRSGENISAAEVEQALTSHEAVLMAAVVSEPDPLRGEEVRAYVVLKPALADTPLPQLASHLAKRLAPFKLPRYWCLCRELPFTPSERVAKHGLSPQAPFVQRCWDAAVDGPSGPASA